MMTSLSFSKALHNLRGPISQMDKTLCKVSKYKVEYIILVIKREILIMIIHAFVISNKTDQILWWKPKIMSGHVALV